MSAPDRRSGPQQGPPVSDEHLREQVVAREQVWRGHFLDVRRDTIVQPGGHSATREYIVHPGAVMVSRSACS